MAKSNLFICLGLLLAAGCGTQQTVQSYPAPNFNGPVIAQGPPAPTYQVPPNWVMPKANPRTPQNIPREWVPVARANSWKWIVIHHSATPAGSAAKFDREHRQKGWDELGYHFVIGNGTNSGNGQVEVGSRWPKQKWGAHAKTPNNQYNNYGIGICLVGNFDVERPTPQQIAALDKLVAYLMRTYNIPPQNVIGHGETKATDCPGRFMNVASVRRDVMRMLAEAETAETGTATASAGRQ